VTLSPKRCVSPHTVTLLWRVPRFAQWRAISKSANKKTQDCKRLLIVQLLFDRGRWRDSANLGKTNA